jgi:hypothetical protein
VSTGSSCTKLGAIFGHPEVGAVPVELDRAVQRAIRLVALFGIHGHRSRRGRPRRQPPVFAQVNPLSPTFLDSRAVMVGAGQAAGALSERWERALFPAPEVG